MQYIILLTYSTNQLMLQSKSLINQWFSQNLQPLIEIQKKKIIKLPNHTLTTI